MEEGDLFLLAMKTQVKGHLKKKRQVNVRTDLFK